MKRIAAIATFFVLILAAKVYGQGDAANSDIESSTNYFRSEGGSGSAIHRQWSSQYPQQTHNLDEAERQRLRIQWGERIFGWHHPRDLSNILNWAEKEGQFRSGPLRPGNDPVLAADQLYRRRGVARLPEFEHGDPAFEQAYRMVQHLGYRPADTIRWSEERQEYVGK